MDAVQRDHILELIDNDTHLRQRYVSIRAGEPQYCVIGCMLADSGVDVVAEFHGSRYKQTRGIAMTSLRDPLAKHFDLDPAHISRLQHINDDYKSRKERQYYLKAYVNTIPLT